MIRRKVGDEFWLIAQHDHALVAGELARHVGNKLFERPRERRESVILAVAQHDCGWPVHDDAPTLNREHFPLDVFESTRDIALKVWQASVERVLALNDEYAALLVSLHVLALSTFVTTATNQSIDAFDPADRRTRFEVNRFQHKQIEIQESLRASLGLPTDAPMRQGLVEDPVEAGEQLLQFHFRLLQAMDLLSLGLCCTTPPIERVKPVLIHPAGKSVTLQLRRETPMKLRVSPWPFAERALEVSTAYRRVPGGPFSDDADLQQVYRDAPKGTVSFTLEAD